MTSLAEIKQKPRIDGPDILRGMAALSVIVVHLIGNSGIKFPHYIEKIGGNFTACVTFFFAISAFSIAYAYSDDVFSKEKFKNFYLKRIFRLAPLFYVAFIVEATTVYFLYDHSPQPFAVVLSFSFLFSLVPSMQDSLVWAGWSLGIEWLFYLIYPILICFIKTKRSAVILWIISCFVSVEMLKLNVPYTSLYMNILNHMPFFISGIIVYLLMPRIESLKRASYNKAPILSSVTLVIVSLYLLFYFYEESNYINIYVTYSVAWCVLISVSIIGFPAFLNNTFTRFLGKASYSIYLNHSIVILVLKLSGFFIFVNETFKTGEYVFLISMFSVSLLTLLLSYLTYYYVEIPGMNLGKKVLYFKSSNLKRAN